MLIAGALAISDALREWLGLTADSPAETGELTAPPLTAEELESLAGSYTIGGRAVLAYFDSLFTDELARQLGVSHGVAQGHVATADLSYVVAHSALDRAQHETSLSAQGRFAAASSAFLLGAGLVNRFVESPAAGRNPGKDRDAEEKELEAQVLAARMAALEAAGRAKAALGSVPVASRTLYLEGRGFSTGGRLERQQALTTFWMSALQSDLAASLHGGAPAGPAAP